MSDEKAWFRQAEADFKKAKILFEGKAYDGVASNCQQCVEKCLKAMIIKNEGRIIKVHDLVLLGKRVGLEENLLNNLKILSTIYIDSRYGIIGEVIPAERFKKNDGIEFLEIANKILKWTKKRI